MKNNLYYGDNPDVLRRHIGAEGDSPIFASQKWGQSPVNGYTPQDTGNASTASRVPAT
jgi:hypothetical protein